MTQHRSLQRPASDLIAGRWVPLLGSSIASRNPATPAEIVWSGSPVLSHVNDAVDAARRAFPVWSAWPAERRFAVLRRFQQICKAREQAIADLICDETGKVMWDAKAEAGLLASKVDITLDESSVGALRRVAPIDVPISASRTGRAWFKPHGVMAVLGPYNFPVHLPNGHIVPALAMGNTVVLKPSDKTPACGQLLGELFQEALDAEGAPPGVVNVVQGAADVASLLAKHDDLDGILFTGSWPVGRKILEANLDRPSRIIALEMGGNNPAVVMPDADLNQALVEVVRSAFVTTGQRCTCTRRLIVHDAVAARLIPAVCKAASNLIVGDPRASHPVFMGPIINEASRRAVLEFQTNLARAEADVLVPAASPDMPGGGYFITPSVVRVDRFSLPSQREGPGEGSISMSSTPSTPRSSSSSSSSSSSKSGSQSLPPPAPPSGRGACAGDDIEVFGPLLRVCVVGSLDDAIEQANATNFGLAAAIFTKDPAAAERFQRECRAGCINVNTGTAGASSKLPFGGVGLSGNHRPAGSFSVDYCAYPVAGMTETGDAAPMPVGMRVDEAWLR